MKKIFALLLVVLSIFAFISCDLGFGKKDSEQEQTGDQGGSGSSGSQSGDQGQHDSSGGDSSGGGSSGGSSDPGHEHTFETAWTNDWTYHWHAATCGHTDAKYAKDIHTYANGVCSVCGFTEPKLGGTGPAGGIIFYDAGSYTNGWRFLEAAPSDLRVVNGVPTVDSSTDGYSSAQALFAYGLYVSEGGEYLFVNGNTYHGANRADITRNEIGQGNRNTQMLVSAMGEETYRYYDKSISQSVGHEMTKEYAARMCDLLVYGTYDDWFLPSNNELNLLYENLKKKGLGGFVTSETGHYKEKGNAKYKYYWSSSESDMRGAGYAWMQSFDTGSKDENQSRSSYARVRPIRSF